MMLNFPWWNQGNTYQKAQYFKKTVIANNVNVENVLEEVSVLCNV